VRRQFSRTHRYHRKFSSDQAYREGFRLFTPGFRIILFGDAQALRKAITPNTCAFLVEPIRGEAGIVIPPEGFLRDAAEICRQNRVLMMVDEIQSGSAARRFASLLPW
jgi:ornithine--oxo-acid transaminase